MNTKFECDADVPVEEKVDMIYGSWRRDRKAPSIEMLDKYSVLRVDK